MTIEFRKIYASKEVGDSERALKQAFRALRSANFCANVARYWLEKELSVPALHDHVLALIFDFEGKLLGTDGQEVDLYEVNGDGFDWMDRAFGKDAYRTIHRLLARAEGNHRSRLSVSLINAVLLMHYARLIAEDQDGGVLSPISVVAE